MKLLDRLLHRRRRVERPRIDEKVLEKALEGSILDFEEAMAFLNAAEALLSGEPQLVKLRSFEEVVFVGDTHGDLESSRAVIEARKEGRSAIIFLGDYVDRGPFQIENANFLLAHHLKAPDRIILLRGNHESPVINLRYGFLDKLNEVYGSLWPYLFVRYNEVFSSLPYAAVVNGVLALHGGIAEGLRDLSQIEELPKKDLIPSNELAFQLLWNDPSEVVDDFGDNPIRGEGTKVYGRGALKEFLSRNGLKVLVRSHEARKDGYEWVFADDDADEESRGKLLSVFTCRFYGIPPTVAVLKGGKLEVERL